MSVQYNPNRQFYADELIRIIEEMNLERDELGFDVEKQIVDHIKELASDNGMARR
jgi:hypothetical protein